MELSTSLVNEPQFVDDDARSLGADTAAVEAQPVASGAETDRGQHAVESGDGGVIGQVGRVSSRPDPSGPVIVSRLSVHVVEAASGCRFRRESRRRHCDEGDGGEHGQV
jgi:hypothetical protein